MRRATRGKVLKGYQSRISIHALRAEGDAYLFRRRKRAEKISIHALRAEGDPARMGRQSMHSTFLSTPSVRRATQIAEAIGKPSKISIHALRAEGDGTLEGCSDYNYQFLSTPSVRSAT